MSYRFKSFLRAGLGWAALLVVLETSSGAMAPGELTEGRGARQAEASETTASPAGRTTAEAHSFIIAGSSARAVAERVEDVGGKVTHELGIIRAVAAELTAKQLETLKKGEPELKIRANGRIDTTKTRLLGAM